MSGLPAGWCETSIFEISKPKQWKTIPKKKLLSQGYTVYGANGIIGYYSEYTHLNRTLMITCRGASCGNVHISLPKSYINGNAMALDNFSSQISIEYVYYFLKHDDFKNVISGSAQPQITQEGLKKLKLKIPPLNEQIRIANKLDSLLGKLEATQKRLDKIPTLLKRYRQSVLAAATSGKLSISQHSWNEMRLGDLLSNGPQNGIYKPSNLYGTGIKIIRIDGFYEGKLQDWDTFKRVDISKQEKEKWKLNLNDILINRVNSIEYLGKCGLVEELPENAVFESNIMRISLNDYILPHYLRIFLTSPIGISRLRANAKHAVNQASINQGDVKNCTIELPSLKEQKQIVKRVEALFKLADQAEQHYQAAKLRTDKLTQSILAKAFRGELVPQAPNDEPASELLAQIQAEKDK